MATSNDTIDRILNGALRAIARHGPNKLSMSDICGEAGVSRGTLYRYFHNKNELLLAISKHIRDESRAAIEHAIAADPAPERRLYVVLDAMVRHRETHPEAVLAIEREPAFTIQWLRQIFPEYVTIVDAALDPVFSSAPAVKSGLLSRTALAEFFLRVVISTYLIPTPESAAVPVWLTGLWDFLEHGVSEGPRDVRAVSWTSRPRRPRA